MELIYFASEATFLQDILVITNFLTVIGSIIFLIFTLVDWDEFDRMKNIEKLSILALVIFVIGNANYLMDWTPIYAEYYKVDDLELLEQYTEDYCIYNGEYDLYKLVEKNQK